MKFLKPLSEAVADATKRLRQQREQAQKDAASAARKAEELEGIATRYAQLVKNVEGAREIHGGSARAFEDYCRDARHKALTNLVIGFESGNWQTFLPDLAQAECAHQHRKEILAALEARVQTYEKMLDEFESQHRATLKEIGVL